MAYPGTHRFAVDLQCKCKESWKAGYFFDDEHLGFVCQSCWKEWLLEEFVQITEEDPVCHNGKTYLSPVRNSSALKEASQYQVTPSREKIVPDYAAESLKRGDHIMWHNNLYWHHAVVEEVQGSNATLIEYTKIEYTKINSKLVIARSTRDLTKKEEPLFLVVYSEHVRHFNPVELVLARANSMLGMKDYHPLKRNCENFATFCKTGVNSNQQKEYLKKRVTDIIADIGFKNSWRYSAVSKFLPLLYKYLFEIICNT